MYKMLGKDRKKVRKARYHSISNNIIYNYLTISLRPARRNICTTTGQTDEARNRPKQLYTLKGTFENSNMTEHK